ncbi:MAG: acyl-[acyl-carrier-protein] thioesterase [Lachnospiraceae bacterium]|nr:acyl-[acyl-carrier-protein] thioesterase [Lachnospiraceae bacterium]
MYEYTERISYSKLAPDGNASICTILDLFQDCSIFDSEECGVSLKYMADHKLIWALSFWQIVIDRFPTLNDVVTVGTVPYDFKGFMGYRSFWLKNNDITLARANSIWSLISAETGRPVKASDEMISMYHTGEPVEMELAERKLRLTGEPEVLESFKIMPHNLDTNRHVNNGQFVRLAADYIPDGADISEIRAEYHMQAHIGDIFVPHVFKEKNSLGVSLRNPEGKSYCDVLFLSRS